MPKPTLRGRPPSTTTAHRQAAAWLRTQLIANRWAMGEALPSLRLLAEESGFSFGAVRQAVEQLKSERRVHVNSRKRLVVTRMVDGAMDGRDTLLVVSSNPLGYRTTIALDLLRGILVGAGELRAPISIAHAHAFESALPEGFLTQSLKGIILLDHYLPATLRKYEALKVPVVLADHVPFGARLASVSVDNRAAARDATLRLVAAGHRRIAFVRRLLYHLGDVDPDSKERMDAFLDALKEAGLPANANSAYNMLPEKAKPTYSLRGMFKAKPPYTAALCADGAVAQVLARAAQEMGREVPRDFGIVCFQDYRAPAPYSGPICDFEKLGLEAARIFRNWRSPAPQVRVPCTWRERNSFMSPRA